MTIRRRRQPADAEIALMNRRVVRGLEFSEDNLALEAIAEVGPGGDFMKSRHTRSRMKTAALFPKVADRSLRARWEASGKPDAQARARIVADDILSRPNPAVWDAAVEARIRAEFPGLVAGDAAWREA